MTDLVFFSSALILSVSCIVYSANRKTLQKVQGYAFFMLLINLAVSSTADIISNYIENSRVATGGLLFTQIFTQYIYFVAHSLLAPTFALYIMMVNGSAIAKKKCFYYLFFIPAILAEVLILSNPYHKLVFFYDQNADFVRGPGEWLIYLMALLYVATGIYYLIKYRKAINAVTNLTLWYFFSFTIAGVIIQATYDNLKVELFAEALSMLGLMLAIEDDESMIDPISRAYNRSAFMAENTRLILTKHHYTVVSLNLTNYRFFSRMLHFNEQIDLLHMISTWLKRLDRQTNVYRVSECNFSLIILGKTNDEINSIIKKITARFNEGWIYGRIALDFNVQMRIANVPEDVSNPELLMELAEDMDTVEKKGVTIQRNDDLYFLARKVQVESALHRAITENRFEVYYQPIWFSGTEKIYSAEALLRLTDPDLGRLSPEEIIPIAEHNGLIGEIGRIVFDSVCAFIADPRFKELGIKYIEVNLSVYQLIMANTVEQFEESMRRHGVTPDMINLEITESASLNSSGTVESAIDELKSAGFHFSLDDYGTGYSNLTYIISMDFLNIKSDKGLLWASDTDENSKKLLMDSIRMMRRLGMNVIQEGVETKEQLDLVLEAGANLIQGYYFSKPLPKEDFIDYVRDYNGSSKNKPKIIGMT